MSVEDYLLSYESEMILSLSSSQSLFISFRLTQISIICNLINEI